MPNTSSPTKPILEATLFCFVFTGLFILFSFAKSFVPAEYERAAHGIVGTLVALLSTYIFLKVDKKSFSDIGLRFENNTLQKFVVGVLLGLVLMGVLTFAAITMGGFRMESNTNSSVLSFLLLTAPLIPLAFMEELGFRAYPLVLLQDKAGARVAILVTSVLFALYHVANGWALQNAFLGAGVWGLIYGAAAVYGKGIALPTGLHYAANLCTSAFGINAEGSNLWILTSADGSSLETYQSSTLEILLPQISLLVLGIAALEWVARKTPHSHPL